MPGYPGSIRACNENTLNPYLVVALIEHAWPARLGNRFRTIDRQDL